MIQLLARFESNFEKKHFFELPLSALSASVTANNIKPPENNKA